MNRLNNAMTPSNPAMLPDLNVFGVSPIASSG
jgi:hypothetical protein